MWTKKDSLNVFLFDIIVDREAFDRYHKKYVNNVRARGQSTTEETEPKVRPD